MYCKLILTSCNINNCFSFVFMQSLEEARCNLQSKYHVVVDGGIKVSFRLVDGRKIEHSFPKECPCKVGIQRSFAFSF